MSGDKAQAASHPALASADRYTWTAPTAHAADGSGVKGAFGGSALFDQPKQRDEVAEFEAFIGREGALNLEIGFDHGFRLFDHACRWPNQNWIGLEVRKARVVALAARAPENLLVWRADARTVLHRFVPASSLDRVEVLFPTPWWDELKRSKRILFSASFVQCLSHALKPAGVVYVATDVGPYFEYVSCLFDAWTAAELPPQGETLSRRERACAREQLPVWRGAWSPPTR